MEQRSVLFLSYLTVCLLVSNAAALASLEDTLVGDWTLKTLVIESDPSGTSQVMPSSMLHDWRLLRETTSNSEGSNVQSVLIGKWVMRDVTTNNTLESMHVKITLDTVHSGRVEVGNDIYDLRQLFEFDFADSPNIRAKSEAAELSSQSSQSHSSMAITVKGEIADSFIQKSSYLAFGRMEGFNDLEIPNGQYQWVIGQDSFTLTIQSTVNSNDDNNNRSAKKRGGSPQSSLPSQFVFSAVRITDDNGSNGGWFAGKNLSSMMLVVLIVVNFVARSFIGNKPGAKGKTS